MSNDEFKERLIDEVRRRAVLWNVQLGEYKNRYAKDAAWHEVAIATEQTELFCKSVWTRLRQDYRKALGRHATKSGMGTDDVAPPWKYAKQMEFIRDITMPRQAFDSFIGLESDSVASDQAPIRYEDTAASGDEAGYQSEDHYQERPPSQLNQASANSPTPSSGDSRPPSRSSPPVFGGKRRLTSTDAQLNAAIAAELNRIKTEDQWDAFGKYVAGALRDLPPLQQETLKHEIECAVHKCKMELLEGVVRI